MAMNYQVVTEKDPLNIRQTPSTSATVIGTIPRGYVVAALGISPDPEFLRAAYNGKEGYISMKYLKETTLPVGQYTLASNTGNVNNASNTNTTTNIINNQNSSDMTITEGLKKKIKIGVFVVLGVAGAYTAYRLLKKPKSALPASEATPALNGVGRRRRRKSSSKKSSTSKRKGSKKATKKFKLN